MRTVHETEALRPSDPVPKSMHGAPGAKTSKLKIIIKTPQSHGTGGDDGGDDSINGENADLYTPLSKDIFSREELSFPADKLYRKCYWEAKWAEDIGEQLTKECKEWEEAYHKEWLEKEALMSQVVKSEVDWHGRRQAILSGAADVQIPNSNDQHDQPADEPVDQEMTDVADKEPTENGVTAKEEVAAEN